MGHAWARLVIDSIPYRPQTTIGPRQRAGWRGKSTRRGVGVQMLRSMVVLGDARAFEAGFLGVGRIERTALSFDVHALVTMVGTGRRHVRGKVR